MNVIFMVLGGLATYFILVMIIIGQGIRKCKKVTLEECRKEFRIIETILGEGTLFYYIEQKKCGNWTRQPGNYYLLITAERKKEELAQAQYKKYKQLVKVSSRVVG